MQSVKNVVSHPASTWSAIAAAAIAIVTAWGDHQETKKQTEAFEGGHYEAIIDLRRKVDYLFGKFVEMDHTVSGIKVSAIKPPGPPSMAPPPFWGDAYIADNCARCPKCCVTISDPPSANPDAVDGTTDEEFAPVLVENPKEAKPLPPKEEDKPTEDDKKQKPPANSKEQNPPFEMDEDGNIKWKPIKRK